MKHDEGLQHELIKGQPSEENQKLYYNQFRSWALENKIPHHFFEVFDEKWKGGDHFNEVEKHWGLIYSNRKPKHNWIRVFKIKFKSFFHNFNNIFK